MGRKSNCENLLMEDDDVTTQLNNLFNPTTPEPESESESESEPETDDESSVVPKKSRKKKSKKKAKKVSKKKKSKKKGSKKKGSKKKGSKKKSIYRKIRKDSKSNRKKRVEFNEKELKLGKCKKTCG